MPSRTATFDSRIYDTDAVLGAVEAFTDFGEFEVDKQEGTVVVTAELEDRSIRQIWGEFRNYILVNS